MRTSILSTLLGLFIYVFSINAFNAQVTGYNVGDTIEDLTFTTTHGETVNLQSVADSGKWILLDFFYSTCDPCIESAPAFSELHEKYGCNEGDLFCLSISASDGDEDLLEFETTYAAATGFNPAPAVSADGNAYWAVSNFIVASWPTFCLIDSNMVVRDIYVSPYFYVENFEAELTAAGFFPAEMECSDTMGVDDIEVFKGSIQISPNPSSSAANVTVQLESSHVVPLSIFDIQGSLIKEQNFEGVAGENKFVLDIESLPNGQYLTVISSPDSDSVLSTKMSIAH